MPWCKARCNASVLNTAFCLDVRAWTARGLLGLHLCNTTVQPQCQSACGRLDPFLPLFCVSPSKLSRAEKCTKSTHKNPGKTCASTAEVHFHNEDTAHEMALVSSLLGGLTGLLVLSMWASDKPRLWLSLMKIFFLKLLDAKYNISSQLSASIKVIIIDWPWKTKQRLELEAQSLEAKGCFMGCPWKLRLVSYTLWCAKICSNQHLLGCVWDKSHLLGCLWDKIKLHLLLASPGPCRCPGKLRSRTGSCMVWWL